MRDVRVPVIALFFQDAGEHLSIPALSDEGQPRFRRAELVNARLELGLCVAHKKDTRMRLFQSTVSHRFS